MLSIFYCVCINSPIVGKQGRKVTNLKQLHIMNNGHSIGQCVFQSTSATNKKYHKAMKQERLMHHKTDRSLVVCYISLCAVQKYRIDNYVAR